MQAVKLSADERKISGKKVKKLRNDGILPVNVFGKGITSLSLQVPIKEFAKVYDKVGETGLVELAHPGGTKHVLVTNVQIHPVSRKIIHAELHAVSLTEKIKANVPLELVGESPAVQNNLGILLQTLNEVEVEALPTNLPEKIEVDVAGLAELDQHVLVSDLKAGKDVEILTGPEEVVVKVAAAVVEEPKEEEKPAEAVAEGEEGATPTDGGEEAAEGTKEEEKPQE